MAEVCLLAMRGGWVACGARGCALYDVRAVLVLAAILALPLTRLACLLNEWWGARQLLSGA